VVGLAVPLANMNCEDAEWRALTSAAIAAHARLVAEGKAGDIEPDRTAAVWGVLGDPALTAKKLTDKLVELAK
jgi:hypothetical protein